MNNIIKNVTVSIVAIKTVGALMTTKDNQQLTRIEFHLERKEKILFLGGIKNNTDCTE
jgi:hypothetical protein